MVLMVDRVVRRQIKQVPQIRNFDDDQPVLGQQVGATAKKVQRVVHVRQDVVADGHPRRPVRLSNLFGRDGVEKFVDRLDSACESDLGDVGRRFYAERLHAVWLETFQQAPVIAGDFYYQIAGAKIERLDDRARILAVVRGDCLRCSSNIEVMTKE